MRRLLPVLLTILALGGPFSSPSAAADLDCPRKVNDGKPGETLKPALTLTPTAQSAQKQVNFGTDRDMKPVREIQLTSDRAIPPTVAPAHVNFEALISRSADNLESTDFPDPTFTEPRISPDRKTLAFSACLDPDGVSAGKYVGAITVSGPAGLGPATVNLTVTTKNGSLFWKGAIVALLVGFVLLLFKDAAASFPNPNSNWWTALKVPLKDLRWWGATAIALAVAFGALYGLYANDPAWGASGVGAVMALIGSLFAAIGGKSIVSGFGKKLTRDQ